MNDQWQEKNKVINPQAAGYIDRKMAKWQGLILSEHTESLKVLNQKNKKVNKEKEKQPEELISHFIDYSFSQKKPISIQMNYVINGLYEEDIIGVVAGYVENNLYVETTTSEIVVCSLDLIRHVDEFKAPKWFTV